jgi:hypothetical protein
MATTVKRLAATQQVTSAGQTLYTVPASTQAVVQWMRVQNPSGSPVTFTVSVGAIATAANRLLDAYSIPAAAAGVTGSQIDFYWRLVLQATETLQVQAGTNNILTVTVSGIEQTLG